MSDEGLIRLIEEAFSSRYGEALIGVSDRTMVPHEVFVEVRVKTFRPEMEALGEGLSQEFEELGKRVVIWVRS